MFVRSANFKGGVVPSTKTFKSSNVTTASTTFKTATKWTNTMKEMDLFKRRNLFTNNKAFYAPFAKHTVFSLAAKVTVGVVIL
jgi:hypothetical protein